MRILGLDIRAGRDPVATAKASVAAGALTVPASPRGWFSIVREGFTGAWQRNIEFRTETVLANTAVFRCVSLISSSISKLCFGLVEEDASGITTPVSVAAFSPVLTKPNDYQNRIQFIESWVISKLTRGNAYVLKERDNRGVVTALHVLDPARCWPLVSTSGEVFYRLGIDLLAGVESGETAIPASEIIHDRWNCLFHPLVGLSPIFACGLAAIQGIEIASSQTRFFKNGARPGGILTSPTAIGDETAERLKAAWQEGFTGDNAGKVAVLGDGLSFQSQIMTAVDAQLIEQLRWSGETICGVFGVPAYMANIGPAPLNNNVEALAQQFYGQCLQIHIESIELCLVEGLKLPGAYCIEADLDGLLRMDTASQVETLARAVTGGLMKPDEGRAKLNYGPVRGGDAVYLQQQNWSLEALSKREASGATPSDAPAPKPANDDAAAQAAKAMAVIKRGLAHV